MVMSLKPPGIVGPQNSGSYTPADVERRRRLAESMAQDSFQAREPIGALAKLLTSGLAGYEEGQASKMEEEGRSRANASMVEILTNPNFSVEQLLEARNEPFLSREDNALVAELIGQKLKPQDPYKPDWQTFNDPNTGDIYRYDQNAPDAKPSLFYDAADKAAEPRGNVSADGIDYGDPGAGLVWQRDPTTNDIAVDERGAPIAIPFQGSKLYDEMLAANDTTGAPTREEQQAGVVVQDIDRAMEQIKANPFMTTGPMAQFTGWLGGTPAANVGELLKTVKANAGFDELQAMRESSPTGGALGSITEREIAYLQATIGSLEQSQNDQQLRDNLVRVKNAYLDAIHGVGNGPPRERPSFEGQGDASNLPDPLNPDAGADELQVTEGAIAENPETGERIIFRNGRWERL